MDEVAKDITIMHVQELVAGRSSLVLLIQEMAALVHICRLVHNSHLADFLLYMSCLALEDCM